MADWSTLPTELIHFISQRLPTSTDLLRFRSVCPTWRAAVQLPPAFTPRLPTPFLCREGWSFRLLKCTTYCIQSQLPDHSSWIVKLYRENPTRMHLIDPLTRFQFKPVPDNFPKCLNTLNFRVKELCEEYTIRYEKAGTLLMEKVAVLNDPVAGFVLLTVDLSGKLMVCDEKCRVIEDLPFALYHDLILREGRFYAVDTSGRLLLVNHADLNVSVVGDSIGGGDRKALVNSNGELLLVDLYLGIKPGDGAFSRERIVKFKVFRLDENVGKWVEVSDLGDMILFLGDDCMYIGNNCIFSVSASEIFCNDDRSSRGNSIIFDDRCLFFWENMVTKSMSLGVGEFDLESGIINGPNCYSKLFWPPPDWVSSATSVEVRVDENSDVML